MSNMGRLKDDPLKILFSEGHVPFNGLHPIQERLFFFLSFFQVVFTPKLARVPTVQAAQILRVCLTK